MMRKNEKVSDNDQWIYKFFFGGGGIQLPCCAVEYSLQCRCEPMIGSASSKL